MGVDRRDGNGPFPAEPLTLRGLLQGPVRHQHPVGQDGDDDGGPPDGDFILPDGDGTDGDGDMDEAGDGDADGEPGPADLVVMPELLNFGTVTLNLRTLPVSSATELRADKPLTVDQSRNAVSLDVGPGDIRIVHLVTGPASQQ